MEQDLLKILISREELERKITELGEQISEDYGDKKLLLVSVLKGSVVFMADLMRTITIPCQIDFLCVSSYGSGHETSGQLNIIKDLAIDLRDWDLLLVEDILDTGLTLSRLKGLFTERGAKSVKICTLLDKPERRQVHILPDYVGFSVPDCFVVGYGLDYDEKYRNLPCVGILKPEVYTK